MKQFRRTSGLVGLALLVWAVPAWGAAYDELVPWSTINGAGASTSHFAMAIEGQTSYHNLTFPGRITRVDNLNGTQTMTELISSAQWTIANGGATSNMSGYYGFGVSGDYLQFAESGTDAVWRVDKNTPGTITEYVSKAQIGVYNGLGTAQLLSPAVVAPNGEMTFYEGSSDSILQTAGAGNLITVVSAADLTTYTGNTSVSGGLGYDADGTLYWGNSTNDDFWKRTSDGTISQVLTTAEVIAVTGAATVGPRDIFPAPDGWIYMGELTSGHILRFKSYDPAGTLQIYRTKNQLLNGPAGSSSMVCLDWYEDAGLAFHRFNDYGLYVIPEPASLSLLGLGALVLLRRRR
ncbi:MAG TPA: PEP-CTERM sorting domain-containing protein [Phycisphaerae bacterium]|nr:PEP-CTERM sorting domain-containing protein [Phycisphaerae bacterium]